MGVHTAQIGEKVIVARMVSLHDAVPFFTSNWWPFYHAALYSHLPVHLPFGWDVILFHGATAPSGLQPPHYQGFKSHSDTPHSVRILWTSDRPIAGTILEHTNTIYIYIYIYITVLFMNIMTIPTFHLRGKLHLSIQSVPRVKVTTSGVCSLC